MFKNHFTETIVVVLAVVMGLIMSISAIFIDHLAFHYGNVFKLWGMITLVILLVSMFIPYKEWSKVFVSLFPVKEGTLPHKLLDGVIPTLVLNTVITVAVSGANIMFNEAIPAAERIGHWTAGMLHDWPITFVISYFAAFLAEACGVWVNKRNGVE